MNYYPFDSRNILYRNKIGALAEGETLRLKLLLHKDAHVKNVYLVIRKDNENEAHEVLMTAADWLEDYRFYECEINFTEGIYWYSFHYTSDYGDFYVKKTSSSLGIVSPTGADWQQTVFEKGFSTPDWIKGGIIYQIFPDRFYCAGEVNATAFPDRYICTDWEKMPEYKQSKTEKLTLGNDYYMGNLKGITEKLDYLKGLGVTCIYLNPIFEAHSNHRYNTADYMKIDPFLGNEKDLENLIIEAEKRGIKLLLDGVFSHTGDDSVYFNRYSRYDSMGAYESQSSPYYKWYKFENYPNKYSAWWGVPSLPETIEDDPSFSHFITGENGVLRYWLKKGIGGWRLDVADELPDDFLDKLRIAVKSEGEDKFILGEVWEDASNKISYGARRRFLRGRQLDSVMNYPFANAIVDFVKTGEANKLFEVVLSICENYPKSVTHSLMNHIGTHDTPRILTRLGTDKRFFGDRAAQSQFILSEEEYESAVKLLKLAAVLQYTLPGVPSIYYGDEAGLQGFGDPFCRGAYPWGNENKELLEFYKALGAARKASPALIDGDFIPVLSENGLVAFLRKSEKAQCFVALNCQNTEKEISLPLDILGAKNIFGISPDGNKIKLPPYSFTFLTK